MFTDAEYRYIPAHRRGRLATMGPGDAPQVHPVPFIIDGDTGYIEIGGRHLRDSQKYRNIRRDPRVSLVVDDDASPPLQLNEQGGRGIEIRGMAEVSETTRPMAPGFGADIIRILPCGSTLGTSTTRDTEAASSPNSSSGGRLVLACRRTAAISSHDHVDMSLVPAEAHRQS